jgi:prepilin-type N-terminal cleavage/methylation domain-containing protein
MSRRRRSGFTLVELLIAVTICGVLAAIAVPKYGDLKRRATATQILGDFDVMRAAALTFYVDSGYFPLEAGSGRMPPNFTPYLPTNFKMKKPEWTLDYENWGSKTSSKYTKTGIVIGVSVTTSDKALGQTAMKLVGNAPSFTMGSKFTFLISGY